jgi:hypothetical protein
MGKRERKPGAKRGDVSDDDSGYRRHALTKAVETIYGAEPPASADPQAGVVEPSPDPPAPTIRKRRRRPPV